LQVKYAIAGIETSTKAMKRIKIVDIFREAPLGQTVSVMGWVRTRRGNKNVQFVALNDGSTVRNLQIVFDLNEFNEEQLKAVTTGSAIHVDGVLVESMGKGQSFEVQAKSLEVFGTADPAEYPLQKKGHTLEFLREKAHLRPRTATFGAILRIRSTLAFAIHKFFQERGFFYLNTPLITASDCEGAGAMFQVTTLPLDKLPLTEDGAVDYSKDFFGKPTALTVSGQLEGELGATALGAIYTFGPTFRAENSNTPRHLSEFWMIEPEVSFFDITDNMQLAEDFVKFCIGYALDNCRDDIEFLAEHFDKELVERLEFVLHNEFVRLSYTEGIEILRNSGRKFEFPVEWGVDLQSEHERYLVEEHFRKPVILTDYPRDIKAFYMKQNDDGRTVRAMDVLFPKIGEIIGGSEREADYDKLMARIEEMGIPMKDMWWYLDTRRFGTVPHSGFGLGFERLVLFVTGMTNIRDVIPFPRTPNNAEF
jgi:asparaginyl-tRNA synthetase